MWSVILVAIAGCDEAPELHDEGVGGTTVDMSEASEASVEQALPPSLPTTSEQLPDRLDLVGCTGTTPLTGECRSALVDLARSGRPIWVDRALLTDGERLTPDDIGNFYGFSAEDPRRDTLLAILASQCMGGLEMPSDARKLSAEAVLSREDCVLDALPTLSAVGITMHSIGPGLTSPSAGSQVEIIRPAQPGLQEGAGPGYGFRLNLRFTGPTGLAQEAYLESLGGVSEESPLVVQVGEIFQPVEPSGMLAQPVVACEEGRIELADGAHMTDSQGGSVEGFCGAPGVAVPSDQASWHGTGLQIPMQDCSEDSRTAVREQLSAPAPTGGFEALCPHEIWADCDAWAKERVEAEFGDLLRWQERRCGMRMEPAEAGFTWRLVCRESSFGL